jgi:dUTP pyrophosphatase
MIRIKKCREGFKLPEYKTVGSACRDVYLPENTVVRPHSVTKIPLGFAVQLPYGYEMQLRMRSGLSIKFPSYMANGVATIDSDYTGEVALLFTNLTSDVVQFMKGDRICQCVIKECTPFDFVEVDELVDTGRGSGGFGSTGLKEGIV